MADLQITHTHQEGTLLAGSSKGDGVYEILRGLRDNWRWFPSLGQIDIGQSRDRVAKRYVIDRAADALRAAGHTVTVEIDDTIRPRADVLTDQAARLDDRADALNGKHERLSGQAEAAWQRSHDLVKDIPLGQPNIAGRGGDGLRSLLRRSCDAADRGLALGRRADEVGQRAAVVGNAFDAALTPGATARRIERLEAEQRDINRKLNGYSRNFLDGSGRVVSTDVHAPATLGSNWELQLSARAAQIHEQLTHDRMLIAQAIEAGQWTPWDKDSVHKGDTVYTSSRPGARGREVLKVNKVTVSVPTRYSWTDKVKFIDLRRVDCPHRPAMEPVDVGEVAAETADVPDIAPDQVTLLNVASGEVPS